MTTNWTSTSARKNKVIDKNKDTIDDDSAEEDEDGLTYNFYYRLNDDNKNYMPLKSTDDKILETILPGTKEVLILTAPYWVI